MTPVALHHELHGPADAPAAVLLGSLGTTGAVWAPQIEALAAGHRVVVPDHRGHGRSPVPPGPYAIDDLGEDVIALLDALGIRRAALCGLSIGGMVVQWLAAHAPDRVTSLVLLCTGAHLPPPDPWQERAAAVRAAGSVEAVADAVVGRWLTPDYAARHPATRAELRAMLSASPPEGYAACCEAIAAMDLRADLAAIRAPTLVVSATEDPSIPPEHGRAVAAAIAGARYEELSPAAHLASVERADDVTALIRAHLAGAA